MRRALRFGFVFALVAGCGGGHDTMDAGTDAPAPVDMGSGLPDLSRPDLGRDAGPTVAPVFRHHLTTPDAELAMQALQLMGAPEAGGSGSCAGCHDLTQASIHQFQHLTTTAQSLCFGDLLVASDASARNAVACFHEGADYSASKLGVFSVAGYNPWFDFVFEKTGDPSWMTELAAFRAAAAMPPAGHPAFTQDEFDIIAEWFLRGTPGVEILPVGMTPSDCTPSVGPEIAAIVADGATTGWSARNAADGILMLGCAGATTATDCLTTFPLATDMTSPSGANWSVVPGSNARVLFQTSYRTSYWTRSSADGRFVAHGGGVGGGGTIIDLQRGVGIAVDAAYDPGFFPDNSAFIFQGGSEICPQTNLVTGSPTHLTLTEPGCTSASSIGLYQHVGAALDGADYFAVNSNWSGDPGGSSDLTDPALAPTPGDSVTFIAMLNSGSGFVEDGSTSVSTPNEADAVVSPSMRLLVTQTAGMDSLPNGYVLHRVDLTRGATRTIALPEIARYCFPGGKPAISLDDRWLVTHHRAVDADAVELGFTGASDPGWAAYRGTSNVYLVDLTTGVRTRITHMDPGQDAYFPHFRSDGWIYYLVKIAGSTPEYVVATDAALVLASAPTP